MKNSQDFQPTTRHDYLVHHCDNPQETKFDGFYCICTDLNGPATEVIGLNGGSML